MTRPMGEKQAGGSRQTSPAGSRRTLRFGADDVKLVVLILLALASESIIEAVARLLGI